MDSLLWFVLSACLIQKEMLCFGAGFVCGVYYKETHPDFKVKHLEHRARDFVHALPEWVSVVVGDYFLTLTCIPDTTILCLCDAV